MNPSLPWNTKEHLKGGDSMTIAVGEPNEPDRWRVQLRFVRHTLKDDWLSFARDHRGALALHGSCQSHHKTFTTQ